MSVLASIARRYSRIADALGRRGIVLATSAVLLLSLAFGASVVAVVTLRDQRPPDNALAAEMAELLDDVERAALGLLRVLGSSDAQDQLQRVRDRWIMASDRIAGLCPGPGVVEGEVPRALCARLVAIREQLDRDLGPTGTPSPAGFDRITASFLAMIAHLAEYEHEFRANSEAAHVLVEDQRSLLIALVGGTGGAMASSLALLSVLVGAATANSKRRQEAEQSAKQALESRRQLLEAIEAIPVGFALYDRDGRMVMFNSRLSELKPEVYTPDVVGRHYADIIERQVAAFASDEERSQVRDMLTGRFRAQRPGNLQRTPGGHYIEADEIHTPSGYVASCRVDVTTLKQRELELQASEARYRHVADSMVDAVFTAEPRGINYVSPAVTKMFGLDPQQVVGRSPSTLFHVEDLPRLADCLRAAKRDPGSVQSVRLRTGEVAPVPRWVELRFKTDGAPDEQGNFALTGVVRDIDAQVLMEQAQREDMTKLRSIVESSGVLIALVDGDRRIVLANHTFLEAVGRRLEDVLGRRYEAVVHCGDAAPALQNWLDGGRREAFTFDQTLAGESGARRIVRVSASHARDEEGGADYTLFLGVDETARRSAEVRAIDAARLATLGEMATGVAHEINQPLTVIQFAAESMAADVEDGLHRDDPAGYADDAVRRLQRIGEQTLRASGIVRRLQGFARQGVDEAQPFDMAEAIGGAAEMVSEQMRLARIAVSLDLPAGLPSALGHANRLQQVVINLMNNARDAICEHRTSGAVSQLHDRIDIRVFHDATANRLVVEVGDNGPGIPEHVLPRLFESFFTTKPKGKGTGLGLSISTEIIGDMGGTITAENRPQGGALFRLSFPVPAHAGLQHGPHAAPHQRAAHVGAGG